MTDTPCRVLSPSALTLPSRRRGVKMPVSNTHALDQEVANVPCKGSQFPQPGTSRRCTGTLVFRDHLNAVNPLLTAALTRSKLWGIANQRSTASQLLMACENIKKLGF